jgi:predicted nucleic acid-binding protein
MDRSTVLVDSNVLLDIFTVDPQWYEWSASALATVAEQSVLVVNPIIYAEISVRFDTIEELEDALPASEFRRDPLPWESGFLTGKIFVEYRRRGGPKTSPLPDFYIGAHAAVAGFSILTRDRSRYQTYFPHVPLLTPD